MHLDPPANTPCRGTWWMHRISLWGSKAKLEKCYHPYRAGYFFKDFENLTYSGHSMESCRCLIRKGAIILHSSKWSSCITLCIFLWLDITPRPRDGEIWLEESLVILWGPFHSLGTSLHSLGTFPALLSAILKFIRWGWGGFGFWYELIYLYLLYCLWFLNENQT